MPLITNSSQCTACEEPDSVDKKQANYLTGLLSDFRGWVLGCERRGSVGGEGGRTTNDMPHYYGAMQAAL